MREIPHHPQKEIEMTFIVKTFTKLQNLAAIKDGWDTYEPAVKAIAPIAINIWS